MASYSTDRRGALKIISAIGATCAYPYASDELYGQTTAEHHHEMAPAAPVPLKPSFFKEADFRVVSRIADLIIPATDTPGAVGAGVPIYIDMVIGRNKAQQNLALEGVQWLAQKNFMELGDAEQLAILESLCAAADAGVRGGAPPRRAGSGLGLEPAFDLRRRARRHRPAQGLPGHLGQAVGRGPPCGAEARSHPLERPGR